MILPVLVSKCGLAPPAAIGGQFDHTATMPWAMFLHSAHLSTDLLFIDSHEHSLATWQNSDVRVHAFEGQSIHNRTAEQAASPLSLVTSPVTVPKFQIYLFFCTRHRLEGQSGHNRTAEQAASPLHPLCLLTVNVPNCVKTICSALGICSKVNQTTI